MAKDFDFKQFMLQKGEKVGMGIAVALMVILLAAGGYATFKSDNPNEVAKKIDMQREAVRTLIDTGSAVSTPDLPPGAAKIVVAQPVPPLPCLTPNFTPNPMEDTKWQNPSILVPNEFQVDFIRGAVTFYSIRGNDLGVLEPREASAKKEIENKAAGKTRLQQRYELIQKLYPQLNLPPQPWHLQGMKATDMIARLSEQLSDTAKFELRYYPPKQAEELVSQNKAKLARDIHPTRMIVVSASFPYRAQLEGFKRALRQKSIDDLIKSKDRKFLPQFTGIDVQRREYKPGLKDDEGWEDVDTVVDKEKNRFHWAYYRWLLSRSAEREAEDEDELQTIIFNRFMVMPRPKLSRDDYPKLKLAGIEQTLAKWAEHKRKAKGAGGLESSPLNRRLAGEDIFLDDPKEGQTPPPSVPGETKIPPFLPDYCLIRFLDVTIKPGTTYQYRMRVRLDNPNFGNYRDVAYPYLAEVRELEGPWELIRGKDKSTLVRVPDEFFFYARTDPPRVARARDRVYIEAHKWLDYALLDPAMNDSAVPIADWAINNVPVYLGEPIGRVMDNTEVVMWYPTREEFGLAISSRNLRRPPPTTGLVTKPVIPPPPPKVISVDFATSPRSLLVDFEGGTTNYTTKDGTRGVTKIDESAIELLILDEETGKLKVRSTATDMNDPERKTRYEAYAETVKKLKEGGKVQIKTNPKTGGSPFDERPR
jgi:hypothetical protein